MKGLPTILWVVFVTFSLLLASCVPGTTAVPIPTIVPTITTVPSATAVPFPALTFKPGDFYFSKDGKPAMIFSRNFLGSILARNGADFKTALEWAHQGGTRVLRVHLTNGWWGTPWMNQDGTVNETWAQNWDWFFDQTRAEGIYVLPVFGVCSDWNDTGWQFNPLNKANGGFLTDPGELFQPGSATQKMWMAWVQTLVKRWKGRENILGWEIFSEINIASGAPYTPNYRSVVTETTAVDFIKQAAEIIRATDTFHRPTTASLADLDEWPAFLHSDAIDFLNIHPYPYNARLDTFIIQKTHEFIATYHKPVLIGESGLSGASPDSIEGQITTAEHASTGIRHAIWAGVVSGAMNGRGLFWEDSYAYIYPKLAFPFLEKYARLESGASAFEEGVDFTGFRPVTDHPSARITGAAIGNESMVLGWYRDAHCEPPDWIVQPIPAGQTVTITVPGSAANWKVDFYDTKDGTTLLGPVNVNRKGKTITVPLPDFQDDIAFKMTPGSGSSFVPTLPPATATQAGLVPMAPSSATTDPISGPWNGSITNAAGTFSTPIQLSIKTGCKPGNACGTFSVPQIPCSGNLVLQTVNGDTYLFQEQDASGSSSCKSGGYEQLQLLADRTLSYAYLTTTGVAPMSTGVLKHP